jgi:hypothetical protein
MMDDGGMQDDVMMDHDEDDDFGGENDDDEDNVSLEEEEFDYEEYENMMSRLITNDPSLTTLSVGLGGDQPPNSWGSFGRAIGMNTQLIKLTLRDGLPTDDHQLTNFFSGMAMNRSIQTLNFELIQFNDNVIDFLSPFLADNQVFHCIKVYLHDRMDIKTTQLCLVSFLLMFDYLREFRLQFVGPMVHLDIIIQALGVHAGLMKLRLCCITIGRRGYNSLVRLLNNSTTLKELHFIDMRGITDDGWLDIFTALQSTRCKLERFKITGVEGVNARTVDSLSNALLHHSTTLKSLQFRENEGLLVVIPLLQDSNSSLEKLNLEFHDAESMTNEELEALTNALVTNSRLKRLELSGNSSITAEGWVTFSAFLRNPNSNLKELSVEDCNHINDTVMNSFADALTINHRLRGLDMSWCDDTSNQSKVTSIGYDTFTCTLCNSSSILSTFNSNHTLEEVDFEVYDNEFEQLLCDFLSEELTSLLQINRENNKNQAARLKIIKTHFSGNDIKMEPFAKMAIIVRPHAIAWMAKDMHLYRFLRAMPSLLEKGRK